MKSRKKFNNESDSHILDDTIGTQYHRQCVVAIATSYTISGMIRLVEGRRVLCLPFPSIG